MSEAHFHHMQRNVILRGDASDMRRLLADGLNVNFAFEQEFWHPVLVSAARNGRLDICKVLIDAGADVNLGGHSGMRAIDFAARDDDVDLLKILLDAGASIGPQVRNARTTLHEAARFSARRVAEVLLDRGASVDAQDRQGYTPLALCACAEWRQMAELLLRAGANPNSENTEQVTPFHRVLCADSVAEAEKIAMFAQFGGDASYMPSHPAPGYLTPFQSVLAAGLERRAQQLFDLAPQDPDQKTVDGQSLRELVREKPRLQALLGAFASQYAVQHHLVTDIGAGALVTARAVSASAL
jgi:hypothetical protein